jgi:hypothetical protein
MTSLTDTSKYARDAIKYGAVGFVFLIIVFTGWQIYKARPRPTSPIIPTVKFGKLTLLAFPKEKARPNSLILQTIHGGPPEASSTARVYRIPQKSPSLLSGKRAQQFALKLNFSPEPVEKTPSEYKFVDPDYPARSLNYDLLKGNFKLKYDLTIDPSPIGGSSLPANENLAIEEASTIFKSLGKLDGFLANGEKFVSYLKYENNSLTETTNALDAKFVRIDFTSKPIGDLKVKYSQPNKSSVYVVISGRRIEQERIVQIYYQHFPPDENDFATYPLKDSQVAWDELKSGGGFVASIGEGNLNQVFVRDAYLAYFDPGEPQEYLAPIFVFTGDRGFEAYIQAIDPVWIQK